MESNLKQKHKGALAELKVATWLWEQGYEVFRNMSMYGEIDIIATRDGEVRLIDVKMALPIFKDDGTFYYQETYKTKKREDLEYVYYGHQTDECWFGDGRYRPLGKREGQPPRLGVAE